jgi:hypothetical protein
LGELVRREVKVTDHKRVIFNIDENSSGCILPQENRLAEAAPNARENSVEIIGRMK